MKQVLQNMNSGETIVAEVPKPVPQPGEALVRTAASLVSAGTERMVVEFAGKSLLGKARSRPELVRTVVDKARREGLLTTVESAFNRLDQPTPLGYSSAGTIVALGEDLTGFQLGQRVACAGGNYAVHAEYAVVPRNLLASIPDNVDFESAAFTTLGAIALHGFRLSETQLGERVAVIGLGLLGLLMVGIATAAGCQVLGIDLNPRRVALANQMGAVAVLREQAEETALSFSRGRGCDAILICADTPSADPVELAGAIARDRARVVAVGAVGLQIPRKIYYAKELTFLNSRSYGPGRYDPGYEEGGRDYPIGFVRWTEGRNMEAFIELLAARRLDVNPLISHRFPIQQADSAYELITGKKEEPFLGVLLTYGEIETEGEGGGKKESLVEQTMQQGAKTVETAIRQPSTFQLSHIQTVKLGALGAGNFASNILFPALRNIPNLELVGVASLDGASAQHAVDRFGFSYATSDETQIINDPQINTIAILTRHHLHARQILACLAAGKHVYCEKPLALNLGELDQIRAALQGGIDVVEEEETTQAVSSLYPLLTIGFNRRFAPLSQRLSNFLKGRTEPLVAHYRVNAGAIPLTHWVHDPIQSGGRIIGEVCHFIDFLTFLVGEPPNCVTAQGLPDGGRYQEDNIVLEFIFPDRSVGVVSYLANGDKTFPKERLEVFTGGRVAVLDDFRTLELVSNGRRQVVRSRLRQDKGHRAGWEAFVAAVLAGGPAPIPYHHLFGVTSATFAARQALRTQEPAVISYR